MSKETPWDLRWLRQIARDSEARVGLAVATVMSERMDGRTHQTFVSQATVAKDLQISVESVRKAQKRLVEGGHLLLVTAGRGGRNASGQTTTQPNTYRAVLIETPQQPLGRNAAELPNETLGVKRGNSPRIVNETPQLFEGNPPLNLGTIPDSYPTKISHLSEGRPTASDPENSAAWDFARVLLSSRGEMTEGQARNFFGKLLKQHDLKAREMMPALLAANDSGTPELCPYLIKAAQSVAKQKRAQTPGGRNGREVQYANSLSQISAAMRAAAGR